MARVLLICGAGEEVGKSISALSAAGFDMALVGIEGIHSIDPQLAPNELGPGEIGKLFDAIDSSGATRIATVGSFAGIRIADIKPDRVATELLAQRNYKPDELTLFQWMNFALDALTSRGLELVSVNDLIAVVSHLAVGFPTKRDWNWTTGEADYHLARRVQKALNHLEIGEAIVVRDGSVLGIEVANDSTDAVLSRIERSAVRSGVLLKWPFIDIDGIVRPNPTPKIGLRTAELANAANLAGIVIHERTQVWDGEQLVAYLDENDMFLRVVADDSRN